MSALTVPARLSKGDTIGFVSPSAGLAPFAMHRVDRAKAFLENQGYVVKIAENALKNNGYVSASVEERIADLHSMFLDPSVAAIVCLIGGNHSNQLLKHLDYGLIRKNPKIFVGYSDITVLHYALQSQAGLQTYYGPCAMTQFGEFPEVFPYTLEHFTAVLTSEKEIIQIKASDTWTDDVSGNWFTAADLKGARPTNLNTGYRWLREGQGTGPIMGGCVPSLMHVVGTQYWVDPKESLFFLDIPEGAQLDEGLSLSDLDAYCANLDNAGVFEHISGLIIGRPYHYSDEQYEGMENIILKYAGRKTYPILANANVGHADPIVTLPYQSVGTIDSRNGTFVLST